MSIQVKGLTYRYETGLPAEEAALRDVSFSVEDGQIAAIIGHTGSGKSTLLQQLNGLLHPTAGQVLVDGEDITAPGVKLTRIRRQVGLVFQYPEYQLFEETVAADVAFGPKNLGLPRDEVDRRVRTALDMVGLPYAEFAGRSPFQLSGGQKRRVAIAGVLAMEPRVLLLDEPTAGLDPGAHADMVRLMQSVHERTGNITIFVSHNMEDVARLADRIIVLSGGHVVMQGTPREVFGEREALEAIGLGLPPVTAFTENLRRKGLPLSPTILSVEQAATEIASCFRRADAAPRKSGGETAAGGIAGDRATDSDDMPCGAEGAGGENPDRAGCGDGGEDVSSDAAAGDRTDAGDGTVAGGAAVCATGRVGVAAADAAEPCSAEGRDREVSGVRGRADATGIAGDGR